MSDKDEKVLEPKIGLNTKPVPIIIVLLAAAVSCVISILQHAEFGDFVFRLLKTVIIFAIIGTGIKICLDFIFNKKSKVSEDESNDSENEDGESDSEDEEGIEIEEELEPQEYEDDFSDTSIE